MSEQAQMFLTNVNNQIDEGQFDEHFTIPFMTRDLLKSLIKARLNTKLLTGSTPLLSEREINDAIKDAKETAATTAAIFLEMGVLERAETGIRYAEKWKMII